MKISKKELRELQVVLELVLFPKDVDSLLIMLILGLSSTGTYF